MLSDSLALFLFLHLRSQNFLLLFSQVSVFLLLLHNATLQLPHNAHLLFQRYVLIQRPDLHAGVIFDRRVVPLLSPGQVRQRSHHFQFFLTVLTGMRVLPHLARVPALLLVSGRDKSLGVQRLPVL